MSKFLLISLIPIIFYYLFLYFYCNDDYLPLKFEKVPFFIFKQIIKKKQYLHGFRMDILVKEILNLMTKQ